MIRKSFAVRIKAVFVMGGILLCAACSRPSEEQRLRDTIAAMEVAIEAGESGDFIEHVSAEFTGQGSGIDQRQLRAILLGQSLRHENISVLLGPLDVKMFESRATVKVRVLATGGSWFPETGRQIDIESDWQLDAGEWVCFRAEWE